MGTAFTTRARTHFTAAMPRRSLILICAKRPFLLSGTIASQRAFGSPRWALHLARTTLPTASSSIPTSSNAASRCPACTTCGTSWTGCTTTIFTSIIPSITSRTPAIPGSFTRSRAVTFTSVLVRVHGRTVGLPTASQKFSPAKASATRWTIGARRAATIGRTGNTRCGNTSRNSSRNCLSLFRCLGKDLAKAQMLELVVALFDDLVVVDPYVAVASKHVNVRLGFPVRVRLAAVGIAEGDMNAREFFILKQNTDHLR